ncbi:glycosyltransferase [Roseburia intestinalis]|uniref:Hyaluronan synthase n=2 Tax=Roseburia intestinalis L1-82 TaxID=536231 RepID=A0AAQ2UB96_9FIRM|nr:glycosyltransferase [Roseburia intestinalis]UWP56398.1 glycosyltransferase [Roseburia intestinalis]VCV20936.1 Hyaluronan synthase [Roseburia intestinalis L1-82]
MNKVSVIMPCYNDGQYIMEAIDSVRQQTYKDWELIIVDDGSDDEETIRIIDSIQDENIKIYHTNHLHPAGARNYGIERANGIYILPVDSDDKIEKTYMEKAVKKIESNDKIGVVYCEADLFGEKTGKWQLPQYSFDKMLLDNIVFVTALFYKKDWESVGGFNTNMEAGMEDYDFWLGILELGKEIYQIPEILFHYRIKPVSRTTGFQSDYIQIQKVYRQIYDNHKHFYKIHQEDYDKILRDALIEQIAIRSKYEKQFEKIERYYRIPIVRKVLKKLI